MDTVADRGLVASVPSPQALAMVERLIGFSTASSDSNLGLIEFVPDYLECLGAATRLTYDGSRKKANLFATLGEGQKPGSVLCGPGDIEQAHRPNEFVSLGQFAQCERFMVRLATQSWPDPLRL